MYQGRVERRKYSERREEVNFKTSIFGTGWQEELREIDKHEIIVKICDILGPCPSNLQLAEEIFEGLKFEITRYVLHHLYAKENGIRSRLLLWLDSRTNPDNAEKLSNFIDRYLK